ncbi:MAG: hypothetical protein FWB71_07005 [Defluviitaleaceae bacterium]|nr:hypothetical protein [Defluviitaleaceae bacterium]
MKKLSKKDQFANSINKEFGYERAVMLTRQERAALRPKIGLGTLGAVLTLLALVMAFLSWHINYLFFDNIQILGFTIPSGVMTFSLLAVLMPALLIGGFLLARPYRGKHFGANFAIGACFIIVPTQIAVAIVVLVGISPALGVVVLCIGLFLSAAIAAIFFRNKALKPPIIDDVPREH